MSVQTSISQSAAPATQVPALRRFAAYSLFAACYTYALIVFGGIVRITGSGMGCGDDWPKCNGRWIPEFTLPTLIEYVHRLLGVSIGLVLIGVLLYALRHRRERGFAGRAGVLRPAVLVFALVVAQGLLGAVTVWLEIPPGVVVVHFATALVLMAVLLVAMVRAQSFLRAAVRPPALERRTDARVANIAAALGFTVVVLGAFVANNPGAPHACQGFPLCNGSAFPDGGTLVQLHWWHRLFAFALVIFVLYQAVRAWQRNEATAVRAAALASAVTVLLQLGVAAALVLMHLPRELQALHLAVGAAVWGALVLWAAQARASLGTSA